MSKTIEFYFDVGSPASYLAWTQIAALAQRQSAQLIYKPMLLGGVFKATGNSSPATVPAKGNYTRQDFQRFAKRYAVEFNHNPFFPINTMQLMRGITAYLGTEQFVPLVDAIFRAMWIEQLDMGQPEIVGEVLSRSGFAPEEVLQRMNDPAVKELLRSHTEEAVERGVFGAPTCFVGTQMFFGQDRLDFVEEALAASN